MLGLYGFLVTAGYLVPKMSWHPKKYIITPKALTIISAALRTTQRSYQMRGITSMQTDQNTIGKRLGYGTVRIIFMGGGFVEIQNIPSPEVYMQQISDMLD